jgi:hypothetical protein
MEAMPKLLVQITDEQAAWLETSCDRFRTKARLVRDLIDSARLSLDRGGTLGVSQDAPSISNSSIKEEYIEDKPKKKTLARETQNPFGSRVISPDLVPADLLDCQQLLPEFWASKKGTRSEGVWNRVCGKLRTWTPTQRREALERAIASGWGDVFEPTGNTPTQASTRKPLADLQAEVDAWPTQSLW